VKTITTGGAPACVRIAGGSAWVGSETGDIFRIGPATDASQAIRVGHTSELCVDAQQDGIWVVENLDDQVTVLDPGTHKATRTTELPTRPTDAIRGSEGYDGNPFVIRPGFGDVWAGDYGGSTLLRLDVSP
jgi:hypothetical protein